MTGKELSVFEPMKKQFNSSHNDDDVSSFALAQSVEEQISPETQAVRWRPVLILGICLTAFDAVWMTSLEIMRNQGYATLVSLYYNVIFTLAVVLIGNSLISRWSSAKALNRAEVLILFIMMSTGTSFAMLTEYLIAELAFPFYFKTLDPRWSTQLLPHLSPWLTVSDPLAIKNYYLGHANLYTWKSIQPWISPCLGWGIFVMALAVTGICLSALFYYSWRHEERMPFPLVQIPLIMTEPKAPFYRSPLFWIAFAIAGGINVMNAINHVYPSIPGIPVKRMLFDMPGIPSPWSALNPFYFSWNPFLIGMEFFLPVDLLFSIFFFYWAGRMQGVLLQYFGVELPSNAEIVAPYGREQAFGALMVILFFSLWTGRNRLKEAWSKYRTFLPMKQIAGLALLGMTVMAAILCLAGMPFYLSLLFILIYFFVVIGFSRIRAQYGAPSAGLLLGAPGPVLYSLLGKDVLGNTGLSSLTWSHWMGREFAGNPMPGTMEGFALADQRMGKRVLPIFILVGALIGYLATWGTALVTGYHLGMGTAHVSSTQFYFGNEPYELFSSRLSDTVRGSHIDSLSAMGLGGALTLILQIARTRFMGFPLHPVGYALASSYTSSFLWSTALITWLFKIILLRYLGLKGYHKATPFFLGLLLGEFIIGSLISLIGIISGTDMYVFWPY